MGHLASLFSTKKKKKGNKRDDKHCNEQNNTKLKGQ